MNLLEKLDDELKEKNYNEFEKVRYIYIRTCEIFSFDSRANHTKSLNDINMHNYIFNKQLDVTNINDYQVICHNFNKDILIKLINELTNANVGMYTGEHSFVAYKEKKASLWYLDATIGDFPRAKLNVITTGFFNSRPFYRNQINNTDKILGFKYLTKDDYINRLKCYKEEELLDGINNLLQTTKCKLTYSDSMYFIRWILTGLGYPINESMYLNNNYDFHHLYFFDEDTIYCLLKINNNYVFKRINDKEYNNITKKLTKSKLQ